MSRNGRVCNDALAGVRVERPAHVVLLQDVLQPLEEFGERLGEDRDVLDERDGARRTLHPHQERLDGAAEAEQALAVAAARDFDRVGDEQPTADHRVGQGADLPGDLVRVVSLELDDQDRLGRLGDPVAERRHGVAGQAERAPVVEVARRGRRVEASGHGRGGVADPGERQDHHRLRRRDRRQSAAWPRSPAPASPPSRRAAAPGRSHRAPSPGSRHSRRDSVGVLEAFRASASPLRRTSAPSLRTTTPLKSAGSSS